MGFLSKLLGKKEDEPPPEHAVLVYFAYGTTDLSALFELEARLGDVLAEHSVGELDGNEVAVDGSDGTLFMYGPDADALFAAVRPTLEAAAFMKGARVILRYGPPADNVKELELVLGHGRA